MPQPTYAIVAGKIVCKFGNQPLPVVGTTMPWLDLNDKTNWRLRLQTIKEAHIRLHASRPFQSRAVPMSSDNAPKIIQLDEIFDESGGSTLASQKALMSQADLQFLTFDNLTGVLCKVIAFGDPKPLVTFPPYLWDISLQFIVLEPWAQDLTATTIAPFGVNGTTGGSANNFNITYAGSVRTRPVFTFHIPNTNTATVTQIKLQNTTSGEILTVNFPTPLAAATDWVITLDCDGWHVTDGTGHEYDVIGSFPQIYPPAAQVNAYTFTVTTGVNALAGATLAVTYTNRWEI